MKLFRLFVAFAFVCFALTQRAEAVVPPPDGGYPGFATAEGTKALQSLTTGSANTAVGWFSLFSNASGSFNTATGAGSLLFNIADDNTATGAAALFSNTTGTDNTANGELSLLSNTTGVANTAIGASALYYNTGSSNTALGAGAGSNVITASNVICIGIPGADVSNSCFIDNIYGETTVSGTTLPVIVSNTGQLGTAPSAARFKKEIKPMDKASESILALRPVTFHYKSDTKGTPQFGLVAEEVAAVNPDLIVRDKNGEVYTVRYDAVNAMLLNEFLKEHGKVEKLEATVAKQQKDFQRTAMVQQKQIEALTAGLQKVSAQFEVSKAVPQTAENNQ
jgi:hypothetical protein